MSSHRSQSLSDPNYLVRLQNMRLSDDPGASGNQNSHRRASSLNGAAEQEIGNAQMPTSANRMPTIDDYKLYDQNKFITASKLTGPIPRTIPPTISAIKSIATYRSNISPTHSISSVSPQSLYENIYNSSITKQPLPPPPTGAYSLYGTPTNRSSIAGSTYEVIGKGNYSNGNGRFAHTPQPPDDDASHIYENLSNGKHFACLSFEVVFLTEFLFVTVPPPLPAKPKPAIYAQINNDTSGTYVQPQAITGYRQQQSPTLINSLIKSAGYQATVPYPNARSSISSQSTSSYDGQKPISYLEQLVCFHT